MVDLEKQPTWYLYIIETKYKHLYTGITLDWQRRYNEHKLSSSKSAKALKGKGPLTLKYVAKLTSKSDALKAERWVKQQSKATKTLIVQNKSSIPFEHELCNFVSKLSNSA